MQEEPCTLCVNGELKAGDLVLSTPDDDYACLVGTVLEIGKVGTPEHDTENPDDDVHVNFRDAAYSEKRVAEIELMFSRFYGYKKEFGECPIDDAILPPDCLVRITGMAPEKLEAILDCYENAAAFCQSALREQELTERLDNNLAAYRAALLGDSKQDIIDKAWEICAMADTHYYLTSNHVFEDTEVDYLLRFENPLEVVADEWAVRREDMSDFSFALDEVFDKKSALQGGYALRAEPPPTEDAPANTIIFDRESKAPAKPSVLGQLREAKEKSEQQPKAPHAPHEHNDPDR